MRQQKTGWCASCKGKGERVFFGYDEWFQVCEACRGTGVVDYIPFNRAEEAQHEERRFLRQQLDAINVARMTAREGGVTS